jgi:hypothetical protein
MNYNHGTKTQKAALGNTMETPYGMDRSDYTGPAAEERRATDGACKGGRADLGASIKGASAKQGHSN